MTIRLVHRPARRTSALDRPDDGAISPPPQLPDGAGSGVPIQSLLPIIGAMSSVTMIVVLRANPLMVVVGAVIFVVALVGALVSMFSQRGGASRKRLQQRERYNDYLEQTRGRLRRETREVLRDATTLLPPPAELVEVAVDPARRWERRRHDPDFLLTRVGVGAEDWFGLTLEADPDPVQPQDPSLRASAEALVRECSMIHGMPVAMRLDRAGDVTVVGPRRQVVGAARAMLAQLIALHAPEDLQIGLVFPVDRAGDWDCASTAPHLQMDETFDAGVHARRVAPDVDAMAELCRTEFADRHTHLAAARKAGVGRVRADVPRLVVFVDGHGSISSGFEVGPGRGILPDLGITVVHLVADRLHEPAEVTARVAVAADGSATLTDTRQADAAAVAVSALDDTPPGVLEALSRTLAPLRLLPPSPADADERQVSVPITQLLGIEGLERLGTDRLWTPRSPTDFLCSPIGVDDRGAPVVLDLKEAAQGGMGPHGICIGATGSGKSELLRTLILGLSLSHPPEDVSMVLVDFKGGATFAPFRGLPHVAGIIDNLEADPQMIERARASIAGEIVRRQQVLKDADDLASIGEYRALRARRPDLPALPHLFLVIDEFGELLTAEPEFVQLLLTIGRIGRSIGIHLLLSSQRIEAGRLRGLDTYLSYRLGLRTFSEAESSVVLGNADAYHLPSVPGYGILKVDTSVYRRFRAGYVSGPAGDAVAPADADAEDPAVLVVPVYNGVHPAGTREPEMAAGLSSSAAAPSANLVEACVTRLRGSVPDTRPVWLPPLPDRLSLSTVVGSGRPAAGELSVAMGLIDDPAQQRQEPWWVDLSRAGGHVAVLGAPQSGRSTFLRTMAVSIALTRTPREVGIYGMDLTGGGLARLEGFPHVGGVATRSDRSRLRRLAEELQGMLALREEVFSARGIDSLAMMRREHASGRLPELVSADIVLLLDGLSAMRTDFDDLEPVFAQLLQRGGSYGMHVVVATGRWGDVRLAQQSLIGTRFELRINDATESVVGRKLAETLREAGPGRLITDDKLFAQVALPVLDDLDDDNVGDAVAALAERARQSWSGPAAAPIRLLPDRLPPQQLPDPVDEPDAVPLGLRQDTMTPALFEFAALDQHLLVFADSGAGKTTVLRGLVDGFVERFTSDELVVAVMDIRGNLVSGVPDAYLGGHASNARDALALSGAIAHELAQRTAERRTTTSPRVVVVVDDYDLLASGSIDPLHPLLEHLPASRDLRLHVLLTRPVAGAARAAYDPAIQAVRDTGGSGLVMSGERSEGQLWPGLYAEPLIPGRGHFVRRGQRARLIQVADFGSGS